MDITIDGTTYHLTEQEMEALAVRFEIRSDGLTRRYFVDGRQVAEEEYSREYLDAIAVQVPAAV